jgi:hypothetical protein
MNRGDKNRGRSEFSKLKEKNMTDVITIIGAACVDKIFRQKLFSDPGRTAENYGFQLTVGELEWLETLVATQGLEADLAKAGERVCPVRPCWAILAKDYDPVVGDYKKIA